MQQTFEATGNWEVGDGALGSGAHMAVQLEGTGWTGSVTPKARVRGSSGPWVAIGYWDFVTAAWVAAGSAPTADALILLNVSGLEVRLDVVVSAGSVEVNAEPVRA